MQSTVAVPAVPPPTRSRRVSPACLQAAFAAVPDPRRAQGRRFSVAAVLTLAVAAILANHTSEQAIAEWGADQDAAIKRALGFPKGVTPHQSTIQRLFRRLDPVHLTAALARVFDPSPVGERARGEAGIAVDGKAQRGRLPFAAQVGAPVHALTAFCHEAQVVLTALPIDSRADKAEAELTVAPAVLARLDWRGRVLTGDALYCQRALCRQVLDAGGDYLLLVKENQPTLHHDLALLFDRSPSGSPPLPLLDRREARTEERGHGRTDEVRYLVASTDLAGYLDWPGQAQVFRLTRTWRERGQLKQARHYGITSLPPEVGPPGRLLALKRGHWSIENRLHRRKDVTLGEDQSLGHLGHGPAVMACLRDTVVSLLHRAGVRRVAARLRSHSRRSHAVVAFLGLAPQ
jgi:predicted transposase YbfD/YdcC